MRYKDFKISSPAEDLANKLPKLKLTDYDTIDELMQKISRRYKITGQKLHDLFVHKYGHTPDVWIKKIKQRNEEVNEAEQQTYILSINGKPAAKYTDLSKAEMDAKHLLSKFPDRQITVAAEVCKLEPVTIPKKKVGEAGFQYKRMKNIDVDFDKYKGNVIEQGALIDLTKNYQKYDNVVGKILEKKPNGKLSIQIVALSPEIKGPLRVGEVINLHSHYLKNNPTMNEGVESEDDLQKIKDFIKWSLKTLNIQKPYPKITLSRNTEKAQQGHHTGVHTEEPENRCIWVYVENRNLIDIFRTIFHELVHEKQSQLNMIQHGDSYPGSPIEAMADMVAGKYIKIYGKKHPEIFQ